MEAYDFMVQMQLHSQAIESLRCLLLQLCLQRGTDLKTFGMQSMIYCLLMTCLYGATPCKRNILKQI